MKLVPFDSQPAGVLEPHANLARYIDHMILGRFGDAPLTVGSCRA